MFGWQHNIAPAQLVGDAGLVAILVLFALLLLRSSAVLRSTLIPASLIAGVVGLLAGPAILGWLPVSTDRMGFYVYHLLAITFIAVGLRTPRGRATVAAVHVGFVKTVTVLLQGLIGLAVLFAFHVFVDQSISPAVGMLLPLGFGMGPGIALSVGASWESYGVAGAADAGLAIATLGFFVAYGVGVWSVNRGVRDGMVEILGIHGVERGAPGRSKQPSANESRRGLAHPIVSLATLSVGIAVVYLLTFGFMTSAGSGLKRIGMTAEVPVLWSLNFLWANLIAIACRRLLSLAGVKKIVDDLFLDRAVSLFADLLIATAVMAIGLTLAPVYFVPLLLICVVGSFVTYIVVLKTVRWAFKDHVFARFAGLFGEQTGTISSGLALIRILDPGFTTSVARDQVLGSGTALVLGFPLLLLINMPLTRFGGSGLGYAIVAGLMLIYLVVAIVGWRYIRSRFG